MKFLLNEVIQYVIIRRIEVRINKYSHFFCILPKFNAHHLLPHEHFEYFKWQGVTNYILLI